MHPGNVGCAPAGQQVPFTCPGWSHLPGSGTGQRVSPCHRSPELMQTLLWQGRMLCTRGGQVQIWTEGAAKPRTCMVAEAGRRWAALLGAGSRNPPPWSIPPTEEQVASLPPVGSATLCRLAPPSQEGVHADPSPGERLNDAAANYSAAESFRGGSQAIRVAHGLSLPPASSQMAKAPTAPKPAAKHAVFPQMAFRRNYVLSTQNPWCAGCKEPAERKWHFNITVNNRGGEWG